jgi:hypothetical protein
MGAPAWEHVLDPAEFDRSKATLRAAGEALDFSSADGDQRGGGARRDEDESFENRSHLR